MSSVTSPAQPARLSRDLVVAVAMDLVDELGFDHLTMRALGDRLQVAPMALYRHVTGKDDLVDAVIDLAMSRVALPIGECSWRLFLRAVAESVRANLLDLPGLVEPLLARPRIGFNAMRIREALVDVLRRSGATGDVAQGATALVLTYAIGFVALEIPRRAAGYRADGGATSELEQRFVLPEPLFPNHVEMGTGPGQFVSDAQFGFGLECILDGIDARIGPGVDRAGRVPSPRGAHRGSDPALEPRTCVERGARAPR